MRVERPGRVHGPAWTELGERLLVHAPVLLAAARSMTLDEAEAQDLVQTTLEIGLRHADQLRDPRALRPWLLTIEAREAFRLTRRLRRLVRLDRTVHQLAAAGDPLADRVAVRRALADLPPRTRAAIVLHHMAGLSVAETSKALGTSGNTVKTQLRLGLARLRELLADD
ncbi:MAG: sigma-70 family RNA polymerase sigma factor [Chloroflexi bacterium]|nr:sigma-70 family RNA polymerase sigma factor [Chloroflexota bacterium]